MGRLKKIPQKIYSFIDYDDWIEKAGGRRSYKASCSQCGEDRGYQRPNKLNKRCRSCANIENRKKITKEHRAEHSKRMTGREPWNKGLTKENNVSLDRISKLMSEKDIPFEVKKKISCTQRSIDIKDFDGFLYEDSYEEYLLKKKDRPLSKECLKENNYICDISKKRGIKLVAHHIYSKKTYPDKRFNKDNLVCISEELHIIFHKKYGYGNNTKDQYDEFKKGMV